MIQRIQTLHLLAVTLLAAVMLFVPLAWFGDYGRTVTMYAFDVRSELQTGAEGAGELAAAPIAEASAAPVAPVAGETLFSDPMPPYLGILLVLAALLPLVTIFLFRRRLLQIRLCAVEMVLLIGALVMEAVYYFRLKALFADLAATAAHASLKLPMIFPLLALFFVFLASRAIFRDEMLVRAADRIR